MSVRESNICRLCLKLPLNEFVLIDDTARQMLDVLLVKMNFDVCDNPSMCEDCAETIKKTLSFKSVCIDSEEAILLSNTNGNMKKSIDLRDVYASNSNEVIDRGCKICRFCIKRVEGDSFIALDILMKKNSFSEMLKKHMLEMDLDITENPLICFRCRDHMERYITFLRNCIDTERKINTYRKNKGIRSGKKIVLSKVFEYFCEYTPLVPKHTKRGKPTEKAITDLCNPTVEIKEEITLEDNETCSIVYQNGKKRDSSTNTHQTNKLLANTSNTTDEISCKLGNKVLRIELEKLVIKDEVTCESLRPLRNKKKGKRKICKIDLCICNEKQKNCVKCNSQFELVAKRPSEYRCKLCSYRGPWIKPHLLKHRDISEVRIYRCNICQFQSKHRNSLRSHLITHKKDSEVPIFKCDRCDFQCKYSRGLSLHAIIHKTLAEVRIYECKTCDFKTIHRGNLRRHSLRHKSMAEVQTYKCMSCDYETKFKDTLQEHVLTHKSLSEVDTFQCSLCGLYLKSKKRLNSHLRIHARTATYKCAHCDYQTRHKEVIKQHGLKHKSKTEVQMHKCKLCDFQTKYKANVKHHMIVHKKRSEIELYKCSVCGYEAKTKRRLQVHVLTHTDRPRNFKCGKCSYETHTRSYLVNHSLVHKPLSEVESYGCKEEGCKFMSKRKGHFDRHLLTHRTVYKCKSCDFQSKVKSLFQYHELTHEEEMGVRIFRCKCGYTSRFSHNLKYHRGTHKNCRGN